MKPMSLMIFILCLTNVSPASTSNNWRKPKLGLWRNTIKSSVTGYASTSEICLKKEDVEKEASRVFPECKSKYLKNSAEEVESIVTCNRRETRVHQKWINATTYVTTTKSPDGSLEVRSEFISSCN